MVIVEHRFGRVRRGSDQKLLVVKAFERSAGVVLLVVELLASLWTAEVTPHLLLRTVSKRPGAM